MDSEKADLVLEGGGVRGIGLVGAISELAKAGYSFQRVAGASAGAIVGSFVAAGCSPSKLDEIMKSIDYKKFQDETLLSRFGAPGKVASLLLENGIYKGDYFQNWIENELAACGIRTFADLKLTGTEFEKLPKNLAYKLVIVTGDLSKGELVYLPWDYHKYGLEPDEQSVAAAIRTSMSIPFFYKPAKLGESTLIDGGWLSNFPVDAFDSPAETQPDWPTFGINLSSGEESNLTPRKITGPLSLGKALMDTSINGHDQRHLNKPETLARTMFVEVGSVKSTDFNITPAQQEVLFANGQKSAKKFLDTWDYGKYKQKFTK